MTSRAELWAATDTPVHLRLIDGALDDHDADIRSARKAMADIEQRLVTKMDAGFARCDTNANTSRKYLIGILCSVVVAALMLAANVLILGGPS